MRTFYTAVLSAGLLGLAGGTAAGQGFPFQGGRFNGSAMLIRHEGVQAELKITAEQNEKIKELTRKARENHQADFDELEKLEGEKRSLKKRDLSKTIIEEVSKNLPAALTPEQMKRLRQISLQQSGIQAFADPQVQKELGLSPEQQKQVRAIMEATQKEYLKIRQTTQEDFEGSKKKDHELRERTMKQAEAVLTDAQRKAWRQMLGAPFDFSKKPARAVVPARAKAERPAPRPAPEVLQEDLSWVAKRVEDWQPTSQERRSDQIGWAKEIRQAIKLAKEHNRPVLVHAYNDGRMNAGRC